MIAEARLKTVLNKFQELKLLVIGDFYLDAYWYIDKTRSGLSLETPWHTNPVVAQRYSPGAAGTVTNNLNALSVGEFYTLGVIGEDGFGRTLMSCLEENRCITDFMVHAPEWVTPTYLKPIHRGYENVETEGSRFDIENQIPMSDTVETAVIDALQECISRVDGVIIGEQMPHENLGVITNKVRDKLCCLARKHREKIFLADSRTRIGCYRDIIIKPNQFEAKRAIEPHWDGKTVSREMAADCALTLAQQTQKTVYVTLGEGGILVCHHGRLTHIPGISLDCDTDTVGAGDSVSAAIASTLCSLGAEAAIEAAYVGNLVASITVTKLGTTGTATPKEILQRHRSHLSL